MNPSEREKKLDRLAREFERDTKDAQDCFTDPQVMSLPHPLRTWANPAYRAKYLIGSLVGDQDEDVLRRMMTEGYGNNHIWYTLSQAGNTDILKFIDINMRGIDGGYSVGAAGATFHALRHQVVGGRMFTIDDKLVELLTKTDIDLNIPIQDVKLPYTSIYVELGKSRTQEVLEPFSLFNRISGWHAFEGAYVSQTFTGEDRKPTLEITLTGSAAGHNQVDDDAVEWISMDMSKERSIFEALNDAFDSSQVLTGRDNMESSRKATPADPALKAKIMPDMAKRLELILKALLYISLPNIRQDIHPERTEAQKVLNRAQSGAHRRKALRGLLRSRDTILILAPKSDAADESQSGSWSDGDEVHLKPHWRRGHFRRQRHGAALAMTKIIWIAPKLVNAEHLGSLSDEDPTSKTYLVK